jgi:hypothetical protein
MLIVIYGKSFSAFLDTYFPRLLAVWTPIILLVLLLVAYAFYRIRRPQLIYDRLIERGMLTQCQAHIGADAIEWKLGKATFHVPFEAIESVFATKRTVNFMVQDAVLAVPRAALLTGREEGDHPLRRILDGMKPEVRKDSERDLSALLQEP